MPSLTCHLLRRCAGLVVLACLGRQLSLLRQVHNIVKTKAKTREDASAAISPFS